MKYRYLIFLILLILVGCQKNKDSVSSNIAERVSNGEGTIVNILQITNFDWDQLYIFKPYSALGKIQIATNKQFINSDEMPMGVPEGDTLLVFVKDGEVIKHFLHARSHGDFSDFKEDYLLLTPDTAVFKVVHEGYSMHGKWYKLRFIEDSTK